ncbi:MAG TPA: histidine kinase [Paucimonas sp.]|nr:histidine kinase [Paucimonas sp.]
MMSSDVSKRPGPASATGAPQENSGFWPMFRRHAALAMLFNFACVIFSTFVLSGGKYFFRNFVFSMCIGTAAWLFIDLGRYLLWRGATPPKPKFFLLVVAVAPAAYYVGIVAGALLLGFPLAKVLPSSSTATLGSIVFTLTASMIGGWIFWNRSELAELKAKSAEQQARTAAIEKQAMQAQLQLLQTQIEPHMLFNTLANLQGLIALDPARAQDMLDHLIRYLRATLASSRAERTTLEHEFALLDAYLGLMAVRMGARLAYTLNLPDDLRAHRLPPMLLQPLIENAIKHGLEPKIDGGRIDVSAARAGACLALTVADTGLGIDDHGMALDSQPGTQVGLANIRERLQALYGDAAGFTLVPNNPCGAMARLTLPLES